MRKLKRATTLIFPESLWAFIILDQDGSNPNAIRLGHWPEDVYAGRLMTIGERVGLENLERVGV